MTNVALILVVVTLAIVVWLAIEVQRLRTRLDSVPSEGGVVEGLRRADVRLAALEREVPGLGPRLAAVEDQIPRTIQFTGIVAYDGFGDISGNRSRSIALLNGQGDGLVITLLVGRETTHWFTKQVRGGRGDEPLSDEEAAAVRQALSGTMPR